MLAVYFKFFLYETKKLWRYPDTELFWENGVTEMSTTKQPIVYIRGSQHTLAILKLLALEVNGAVLREGQNAINYRFYVPTENALVVVMTKLKNLAQLPFFYITTVNLPSWQWRYHDFLIFMQKNNKMLGQSSALVVPQVLQATLSWTFNLFGVFSAFATLRTLLFLCLVRRV